MTTSGFVVHVPQAVSRAAEIILGAVVSAATVRSVVPVTPPVVALITVVPGIRAETIPSDPPALETVAADGIVESQVTVVVRVCVEPSE